jgi:hypothetical protein
LVLFIDFQGEEYGNLGLKTDALEETAATKLTGKQWVLTEKNVIVFVYFPSVVRIPW